LIKTWIFLKNPIQVSTKDILVEEDVDSIKYIRRLSILYTVTTLKKYKIIEPYAPPPLRRFESMKLLRKYKMHVTLFLRPIIPGITDEEIDEILETGLESGVRNVVFGTMRVNRIILDALNSYPDLHKNVIRYLPSRIDNKFRNLRTSRIKSKLINKAISLGYNVFPSACSASVDASKQACNICDFGPCGEINQLPKIDSDLVKDFLEYVGLKNISVEVDEWIIKISLRGKVKRVKKLLNYLSTVTRRRIVIDII